MPPELCFQPESQLGEARGREGSELDSAARSATAFCLGHSIVGEILQAWGEKEWPEQPLASHAVCLDFPRARSSQPALFSISTYSPQNLERCVLLCSGPSFPVEQKETSIHSTNIYCTPLMRHVPGLWALGPGASEVNTLHPLSSGAPILVTVPKPSPSLDLSARWVNEIPCLCRALYSGKGDG